MTYTEARDAISTAVKRLDELAREDEARGELPCMYLDRIVEGLCVGLSEDPARMRDIRNKLIHELDFQCDFSRRKTA